MTTATIDKKRICTKSRKMIIDSSGKLIIVESPENQFAAWEMAKYLEIITGGKFPVVSETDWNGKHEGIFIGSGSIPFVSGCISGRLTEQAYAVKSTGTALIIAGKSKLANLHGVYHFLEKYCGCSWPVAGERNEYVPRQNKIILENIDEIVTPDMNVRGMQLNRYDWTNFEDDDLKIIDWMTKNRMNFGMIAHFEGWNKKKKLYVREAKRKRGLQLAIGLHSFKHWLPAEKYFKTNPEYFALIKGKRVNPEDHSGGQVCASNPDVPGLMADSVRKFIRENPEIDVIGLGANDGPNGWCECEKCEALEPLRFSPVGYTAWSSRVKSKTYIHLCNSIVELLAPEFPGKRFAVLFYTGTLEPPDDEDVKLHPGIDAILAFFERMYDRPLNAGVFRRDYETMDPDTPQEKRYKHYQKILKMWRKITQGRLYLHEYYMATASTLNLPFPVHKIISEDMKYYKKLGVDGFYTQAGMPDVNSYALNYCMAAKSALNTRMPPDRIIKNFCDVHYGNVSREIQAYYQLMCGRLRQSHVFFSVTGVLDIFDENISAEAIELLRKALAGAHAPYKGNVKLLLLQFKYALMMKRWITMCLQVRALAGSGDFNAAKAQLDRCQLEEDRLVDWVKKNMLDSLLHVKDSEAFREILNNTIRPVVFNMKKKGHYTSFDIPWDI